MRNLARMAAKAQAQARQEWPASCTSARGLAEVQTAAGRRCTSMGATPIHRAAPVRVTLTRSTIDSIGALVAVLVPICAVSTLCLKISRGSHVDHSQSFGDIEEEMDFSTSRYGGAFVPESAARRSKMHQRRIDAACDGFALNDLELEPVNEAVQRAHGEPQRVITHVFNRLQ